MSTTETIKNHHKVAAGSFISGSLCSQFTGQVTDSNSGADMDVSFWIPDYQNASSPIPDDYYFLGMYATAKYDSPPAGSQMLYKAINDDPNNPCFKAPIGFSYIWSKSHCGLMIFSIQAPFGYVGLGCVATGDGNWPSASNVANFQQLVCVRQDLCTPVTFNAADNVWNDHGSGANADASVFLLPTARTGWAANNYNPTQTTFDVATQNS